MSSGSDCAGCSLARHMSSRLYWLQGHPFGKSRSKKNRVLSWLLSIPVPNEEVHSHAGNLITFCLMHGWRRKGTGRAIINALFGTDVSCSQYNGGVANRRQRLRRTLLTNWSATLDRNLGGVFLLFIRV